jgi:hypothetical protein
MFTLLNSTFFYNMICLQKAYFYHKSFQSIKFLMLTMNFMDVIIMTLVQIHFFIYKVINITLDTSILERRIEMRKRSNMPNSAKKINTKKLNTCALGKKIYSQTNVRQFHFPKRIQRYSQWV